MNVLIVFQISCGSRCTVTVAQQQRQQSHSISTGRVGQKKTKTAAGGIPSVHHVEGCPTRTTPPAGMQPEQTPNCGDGCSVSQLPHLVTDRVGTSGNPRRLRKSAPGLQIGRVLGTLPRIVYQHQLENRSLPELLSFRVRRLDQVSPGSRK